LISKKIFEAWSLTDIKVVYTHDDICTRQGPVFQLDWYRKYIFPWYKKFWAPLKKRGKKIFFVGDGNMDMVIDDVFSAGADGIWFEPYTNLERVLEKYGDKKFVVGNMDVRVLMFEGKKEIYEMVKKNTKLGKDCPGYFYCISTHIPHNVPVGNIATYFEACHKLGKR
jgi:uroporphyrinogen-III decarboxylase